MSGIVPLSSLSPREFCAYLLAAHVDRRDFELAEILRRLQDPPVYAPAPFPAPPSEEYGRLQKEYEDEIVAAAYADGLAEGKQFWETKGIEE